MIITPNQDVVYDEVTYYATPSTSDRPCANCAFDVGALRSLCNEAPCMPYNRDDGEDVVFAPAQTMSSRTVQAMRAAGYSVTIFSPEELGGTNPTNVADRLVELGWDVIQALKPNGEPA